MWTGFFANLISFRCIFSFFCIGFFFFHSDLSFSGEEEDRILNLATDRVNIRYEDLYHEFSDLVLRKFCPDQFEQINAIVARASRTQPQISLSSLREIKEELKVDFLADCTSQDEVFRLGEQFDQLVSEMSANLLNIIKTLLDNTRIDLTLDEKNAEIDEILEAEFSSKFNAEKILARLQFVTENDSELEVRLLESALNTKAIDFIELEKSYEIEKKESEKENVKSGRCNFCSRKLGLLPYSCQCGKDFCSTHRLPEEHQCTFDHKGFEREKLRKNNPVIKGDKVNQI